VNGVSTTTPLSTSAVASSSFPEAVTLILSKAFSIISSALSPPKTADPAYFVLFTTHGVCYICLSTLDCFTYRTNFVSTRRGISRRRRRIVDKLQLNWFFRDNVKTWFIVLVWPVCGRGVY